MTTTTATETLTAVLLFSAWAVQDSDGGTWHPDTEAAAEIAAASDPAAAAVRLCATQPMRGQWHS